VEGFTIIRRILNLEVAVDYNFMSISFLIVGHYAILVLATVASVYRSQSIPSFQFG